MLKLTATIALLLATSVAASVPDTEELREDLRKLEDGEELNM